MTKLITTIIVAVLALAAANAAEESPAQPIETRIILVDDIAAYKAANPQLELTPLEMTYNTRQQQIVYTLGNRVSGDRQVHSETDSMSWSTPRDALMRFWYPTSGVGAVVSHVRVVVNQSSNQGRGYVTSGGIGQRFIQFVIEAFNTTFLNFNAQIFGV